LPDVVTPEENGLENKTQEGVARAWMAWTAMLSYLLRPYGDDDDVLKLIYLQKNLCSSGARIEAGVDALPASLSKLPSMPDDASGM